MEYTVEWTIQVDADSPREAAEKALAIQRNPESNNTVFVVRDKNEAEILEMSDASRGECIYLAEEVQS